MNDDNLIRELEARKLAALQEYHRIAAECDKQIAVIRAKRGTVIKPIEWKPEDAFYIDPGRHTPFER